MLNQLNYPSQRLRRIAEEPDVRFLLAKLRKHAPEVYHHSLRTAGLFEMAWGLNKQEDEMTDQLLRSALLHDIGYIHLPPDRWFPPHERHTICGVDVLSAMIAQGRIDEDIIKYHHENLDGTGFPFGIGWREQSLGVRVMRLVDDFDLWAGGIYTKLSVELAMEEIYPWLDVHFDAELAETFNQFLRNEVRSNSTALQLLSKM